MLWETPAVNCPDGSHPAVPKEQALLTWLCQVSPRAQRSLGADSLLRAPNSSNILL